MQDVNGAERRRKRSKVEPVATENEAEDSNVVDHHDCGDGFRSKIWDKAFANPAAMEFMERTMVTAKELGTDDVCVDTGRTLLNFLVVQLTNQEAQHTVRMFDKMVATIIREMDTTSEQFLETQAVVERILYNDDVRDLTLYFITRSVGMMKEPLIRKRLFRVMKAFANAIKPSENEMKVNKRVQQVKGMISNNSMVKGLKSKFKTKWCNKNKHVRLIRLTRNL